MYLNDQYTRHQARHTLGFVQIFMVAAPTFIAVEWSTGGLFFFMDIYFYI